MIGDEVRGGGLFVSDDVARERRRDWESAKADNGRARLLGTGAEVMLPWYVYCGTGTAEYIADIEALEYDDAVRIMSRQLPKELAGRRRARAAVSQPSQRSAERDTEREWRRVEAKAKREARKIAQRVGRAAEGDVAALLAAAQKARECAEHAREQIRLWRRADSGEHVAGLELPDAERREAADK